MALRAYLQSRSTFSLVRSLLVFRLCRFNLFVKNARFLLRTFEGIPLVGFPLSRLVIRRTFFTQFVGGETENDLKPVVARLNKDGVGSILDYAAEADEGVGREALDEVSRQLASEVHAESCFRINLQAVAAAKNMGGFAAIKITGMGDPELLKAVTSRMHEHRRSFRALFPRVESTVEEEAQIYIHGCVSEEDFVSTLGRARPHVPRETICRLFTLVDVRGAGFVDYLDFCDSARLLGFGKEEVRVCASKFVGLNPDEALSLLLSAAPPVHGSVPQGLLPPDLRIQWNNLLERTSRLCLAAKKDDVSLMVDAEQSYLQLAIDLVTVTLQRIHCHASEEVDGVMPVALPEEVHARWLIDESAEIRKEGRKVVRSTPAQSSSPSPIPLYNTYQAYLRDCPYRLTLTILRAQREGWALGVKLVRGAYLAQERSRATLLGYRDPIWSDISGTHACYAACLTALQDLAEKGGGAYMVASHNIHSCDSAIERLQARGSPSHMNGGLNGGESVPTSKRLRDSRCPGGVSFGQLLGMSDGLTYSIASKGFAAFKYMPYGPVSEVVPYLLRRAEENSDLLTSNVGKEISDLEEELKRRLGLGGPSNG